MRVLQFCGVAEEFAKGIRPHPGTDFRGIDGQVIKLFDPLPPPWDLGWPPTFTFVQPEMERLLREALERRETVTLHARPGGRGFPRYRRPGRGRHPGPGERPEPRR